MSVRGGRGYKSADHLATLAVICVRIPLRVCRHTIAIVQVMDPWWMLGRPDSRSSITIYVRRPNQQLVPRSLPSSPFAIQWVNLLSQICAPCLANSACVFPSLFMFASSCIISASHDLAGECSLHALRYSIELNNLGGQLSLPGQDGLSSSLETKVDSAGATSVLELLLG